MSSADTAHIWSSGEESRRFWTEYSDTEQILGAEQYAWERWRRERRDLPWGR